MTNENVQQTASECQSVEQPCIYDLEVLLGEHTDKLAFLADAFCQGPLDHGLELTCQGHEGLYYILRDLRDEGRRMDEIRIAIMTQKRNSNK